MTVRVERYHARWQQSLRFVAQRLVLWPVVRSVTRTQVQGRDNLSGLDGCFVLVANHSSHLDATLLVTQLPYRHTRRLAVAAAHDYFYRTWWQRAATSVFYNVYPVDRDGSGVGKGLSRRLLSQEIPLLIFPEGSRARDGVMQPFRRGAAHLCVSHKVPCVPVALSGTHEAMPVGTAWPKSGRPPVTMMIGQPMSPSPAEKTRDFNERIAERIATMLSKQTPYVGTDDPDDDVQKEGL